MVHSGKEFGHQKTVLLLKVTGVSGWGGAWRHQRARPGAPGSRKDQRVKRFPGTSGPWEGTQRGICGEWPWSAWGFGDRETHAPGTHICVSLGQLWGRSRHRGRGGSHQVWLHRDCGSAQSGKLKLLEGTLVLDFCVSWGLQLRHCPLCAQGWFFFFF